MQELLQEERELTDVEVEERLEMLRELNEQIDSAAVRRDTFKQHYQQKIAKADEIFELDTKEFRAQVDELTEQLRRYAQTHITGKKKSLKFPGGTLCFTKQQPLFFIDGQVITNDNPTLIDLVRNSSPELIQTKETARWGEFKKRLEVIDDAVYFKDTGECIPALRAQVEADKFSIK